METQVYTKTLVIRECGECGCTFGMSKNKYQRCNDNGETFYCPNGHARMLTESEVQKLNKMLDNERRKRRSAQNDAGWERGQRRTIALSLAATKGVVTRTKNRVAKGVCPCCNRYFKNLHQHMKKQHPNFAEDKS